MVRARVRVPTRADLRRGDRPDSQEVTKQTFPTTVEGLEALTDQQSMLWVNCDEDICVSHTAWCGIPDTTPAPEKMYQYAQGVQKGLTATKKKKITLWLRQTQIMKQTGRISRLTVPLKRIQKSHLTRRSTILCRTWLRAVWYCEELRKKLNISAKTTPKTKPLLTHWSVAQAGSNDEKNWKLKISLDCPFKKHQNYMKQINYKPWHCTSTWLCIKNCTLL